MKVTQPIKKRVYQALDELPDKSFEELVQFLDFLKFKYLTRQPPEVVALGGLWENLDFDITNKDVRALRQRATDDLLKNV